MVRRAAPASAAVALALAAVALWAASQQAAFLFAQGPSSQVSTWLPPAELGTPRGAPRASSAPPPAPAQATAHTELAGALLCGCAVAVIAARSRGHQPSRSAQGSSRRGWLRGLTARKAEEDDDGDSQSILGNLAAEDRKEKEEAEAVEQEMEAEDDMTGMQFGEDNLGDTVAGEELTAEEAARRGERQIKYDLYPSKHYVLYIAKKNAERAWSKDGRAGPLSNKGNLEVQIALLTEQIRNSVLHCREFSHDFKCRMKLVSMVSRRRALLDKLSWKDLEAYLKVREALKIRHVYRMEVLIGRLPEYKYGIRDRKRAPGRKVAMRLKKSKRLLNRRLATQLRQGKPANLIHRTKKQINSRQWLSRAYDDAENMIADKECTNYIDPLNVP